MVSFSSLRRRTGGDRDARRRLFEKWDRRMGSLIRLKAEADEKDRWGAASSFLLRSCVAAMASRGGAYSILRGRGASRRWRPPPRPGTPSPLAARASRGARGTPSTHHQTRRRDREADAKLADDTFRAAKAHNAELLRLEQEHDTQTALQTMRRAGMIAGVNPPRPDPREPPNETDVEILLRVKEKRPEEDEEKR